MRESGEINDIELGSTRTSPPNHAQRCPRRPHFNFRDGFGKQMQIDLMIRISRSSLSLMSSDILGQELFLWETGMISRTKIINISNNVTFK